MSTNKPENIRSRLVAIILHEIDEQRRYKSLEEITKISGATWRGFWNRNGGSSGEMIEAISTNWPQYSFWLATGITDPDAGHIAPPTIENLVESDNDETKISTEYFKYQIEIFESRKTEVRPLNKLMDEVNLMEQVIASMPPNTQIYEISDSSGLTMQDSDWSTEYKLTAEKVRAGIEEQKQKKLAKMRRERGIKNT